MWKIIIGKLNRSFDVLLSSTVTICSSMVFFLIVSVCYDVGARYFFNKPTSWSTETAAFILLILSFLGAAHVLKRDIHVRMDLIYDAVKKRYKHILDVITSLFSILICAIVVWRGTLVTMDLFTQNTLTPTTMQVVQWPFMAIIPLGMFFFLIEYLRKFIRAVSLLLDKN